MLDVMCVTKRSILIAASYDRRDAARNPGINAVLITLSLIDDVYSSFSSGTGRAYTSSFVGNRTRIMRFCILVFS